MDQGGLSRAGQLQGLLRVTRVARAGGDLDRLLPELAATIAESLGFGTVVVSLHRPAWDDFEVRVVHGSDEARGVLLGETREWSQWEPLLDERFKRHGAYLIPHDQFDWGTDTSLSYVPEIPPGEGPDAWHPEDALFVPLHHTDGHLLGILSVDEPRSGARPSDEELEVLAGIAAHVSVALQDNGEHARAEHHRNALSELLRVSAALTTTRPVDSVLQSVSDAIRHALGFQKVAIELADPDTGRLRPRAASGWDPGDQALETPIHLDKLRRLFQPEYEIEGCYLMPADAALARVPASYQLNPSVMNGRGPLAWNHHWLLVPLHGRGGTDIGIIWVDEPSDRLLPSRELLQTLRTFANQAVTAIESAAQFQEMQFLADHDPLTRLPNRRAFIRSLEAEAERCARYKRPFALVLVDLDEFKALNDRHGHLAGDDALRGVAETLTGALRRTDGAFRIGGDEFALILVEADSARAEEAVERIGRTLAEPAPERPEGLRASFGAAVAQEGAADPQGLFRRADEAMYGAKRSGRRLLIAGA